MQLKPCRGARPGWRRQRGAGLLDALIAMLILTVGMLGMTRMQGRNVAQSTDAQSRQVATQLANELISTVLVDVGNAACYTLPQAGSCTQTAARTRTAEWSQRVAASLPSPVTATSTLDGGSGRLTVAINWFGKDAAETRRLESVTDVRP